MSTNWNEDENEVEDPRAGARAVAWLMLFALLGFVLLLMMVGASAGAILQAGGGW